jgi:predicted small metal-binding protein
MGPAQCRDFKIQLFSTVFATSSRSGDHGIVQSRNGEEHGRRRTNMAITESEPHGHQKLSFRCSDVGPKNCDWQITANSEAEIMPKIEQHGREKHNMKIDDETRKKVHNAIQRKAA